MSDHEPAGPPVPGPPSTALVAVPPATPAPTGSVAATVDYSSRLALGAALGVGGAIGAVVRRAAPAATPGPEAREVLVAGRRVVVGAVAGARDLSVAATTRGLRAAAPVARVAVSVPPLRPVARVAAREASRLAERGRTEEDQARQLTADATHAAVAMAVPVVLDLLDLQAVVDRVLRGIELQPVVERALGQVDLAAVIGRVLEDVDLAPIADEVLAQLDLGELVGEVMGEIRMSSVVLDATGGITTDVVEEVRERTVAADARLERLVARVLRRGASGAPPPGPHLVEGEPPT